MRELCKNGVTIVVEERAGEGGVDCREPDWAMNGARGLKPKVDSDLD